MDECLCWSRAKRNDPIWSSPLTCGQSSPLTSGHRPIINPLPSFSHSSLSAGNASPFLLLLKVGKSRKSEIKLGEYPD